MTNEMSVSRKAYATDMTDQQWAIIEPLTPAAKPGGDLAESICEKS